MKKKHIQDLLDKYFEGETSLTEELELKDFFRTTSILPDEWKDYKNLFTYFEVEANQKMPSAKQMKSKKNNWWIVGIGLSAAATILLLFTLHLPTAQKELMPLAALTNQHDSMYKATASTKKTETKKPVKKEEPKKSAQPRTIVGDHPSTILAYQNNNTPQMNVGDKIETSLAPLDKMDDINNALQKFKYFDLMNKYLPNIINSGMNEEPQK